MQIGLRKLLHLKYILADELDENGMEQFFSGRICEPGLSGLAPDINRRTLTFQTHWEHDAMVRC